MDTTEYIGKEVKALMQLIADIDPYMPQEDLVEVLFGAVNVWGAIEVQLLFPALEAVFEEAGSVTGPARERLNTLYALEGTIHLDEGADGPFDVLAAKYMDAVKFHLIADVQEIMPLAAQLPEDLSYDLAVSMSDLKSEQE